MGLQFENLIVNNMSALLPRLGLDRVLLKSAAPWRQPPTQRKRGCQIDLLLQSEKGVFIVEIKRKNEIGSEIESELSEKVKALALPRDVSVRTALVYDGLRHYPHSAECDADGLSALPMAGALADFWTGGMWYNRSYGQDLQHRGATLRVLAERCALPDSPRPSRAVR